MTILGKSLAAPQLVCTLVLIATEEGYARMQVSREEVIMDAANVCIILGWDVKPPGFSDDGGK